MTTALEIRDLYVEYAGPAGWTQVLRGVDLTVEEGRTVAVVGESGSGKTTLALACMGLLPPMESRVHAATLRLGERDMTGASARDWPAVRGRQAGMVFQDPFSALNPVMRVSDQIGEAVALDIGHRDRARSIELLRKVRLSEPERMLDAYPHQLSGGQRQRIMIAIALARRPRLLVLDEPTTALDVTVQDEILSLLETLREETGMAMLFVTHNVSVARRLAHDIVVMYAGRAVEEGPAEAVVERPRHPYTQGLLRSLPERAPSGRPIPVLEGFPPRPEERPSGCAFHPRCEKRFAPCDSADPITTPAGETRVRCHLYPGGAK